MAAKRRYRGKHTGIRQLKPTEVVKSPLEKVATAKEFVEKYYPGLEPELAKRLERIHTGKLIGFYDKLQATHGVLRLSLSKAKDERTTQKIVKYMQFTFDEILKMREEFAKQARKRKH